MKSVNSDEYQIFLDCLIAARKAADMTQEELAGKLGRPQSFVSKYENRERRLDVIEFLHVARAMGADPLALLRKINKGCAAEARKQP